MPRPSSDATDARHACCQITKSIVAAAAAAALRLLLVLRPTSQSHYRCRLFQIRRRRRLSRHLVSATRLTARNPLPATV